MTKNKIYRECRQKIIEKLEQCKLEVQLGKSERGDKFTVRKPSVEMDITVGKAWLGYVLKITVSHGNTLEVVEDTDNYPLSDRVTDDVLQDILAVIDAFADAKILRGKRGRKTHIAVPMANNRYKFITKGLVFTSVKEVDKDEMASMTFMERIQ